MTYVPTPIDTTHVVLSQELLNLSELLAKNTHDVWALQRQAQGWRYGPQRNDDTKETPCMIPYEALPDSEKDYDRNTSLQTLKLILSLGYRITKADQTEKDRG